MANKTDCSAILLGLIAIMLVFTAARSAAASDTPTLTALAKEAAAGRALQPDVWQGYLSQQQAAIAAHRARTAHWAYEAIPPALDLKTLHLPLAFLVDQFQQPNHADAANALLDAISVSADIRRIKVLLELRAQWGEAMVGASAWDRLLTVAADKIWALNQIRQLLLDDPELTPYSLLFSLLDRFAGELSPALQAAAYTYLRRHWTSGPSNGDGERYWDTLLKIDPERARREIIPYSGDNADVYDPYVVELLSAHSGPSPQVASAVRRWLRAPDAQEDAWTATQLRVLLLKSDPRGALTETLAQIARLVAQKKAQNDLETSPTNEADRLIRAVIAINPPEAVAPLARYAHEPAIDNLTQIEILKWIARRGYAQAPQAIAQWQADNPDRRQWLRESDIKEWGANGRQILQEADRLDKTRH